MDSQNLKEIPKTYKTKPVLCKCCQNLITFAGLRLGSYKGYETFSSL